MQEIFQKASRPAHIEALRTAIGSKLIATRTVQYYFCGERDEHMGDVELETDRGFITLFTLGDGESVGAISGEAEVPERFEVTPGELASWRKETIQDSKFPRYLLGKKITKIEEIVDCFLNRKDTETVAGYRLSLGKADFITFLNVGDEADLKVNATITHVSPEIETFLRDI